MLLNQEDQTEALVPASAGTSDDRSPVVEVVAGWDSADDGSDVIVACRSATGNWYLADTKASISAAQVARLAGRTAPLCEPY
ncbi:hypothetical protein SAMN04489716_6977 [Actinoplanes derwentensis]|uniref:Uncharacterized protein n=1 Tax=Actinoplanes derwentensis TaxID=113562 RepID=A0A1H2CVC1_9ACTN|nr:hypothetical protein Ade03nite_09580 [Actinoplanes derwentensis]SDT74423.1 hypothetical protein SAMN04489716_6977 [Actinoplanes derwentensis]